jgi:multiple antibiotic resistance protein
VQLAGGVVIAAMGWRVLNEPDAGASEEKREETTAVRQDEAAQGETSDDAVLDGSSELGQKVFYPFTFPVTTGPGTLVAMLTLSAHMVGGKISVNALAHLGVFLAVVVLSGLVYVCYAYAPKITKAIPPSTAHGILRVVAFILLCIGVQIAWNGLSVLLGSVAK